MPQVPDSLFEGPAAWKGCELVSKGDWIRRFDETAADPGLVLDMDFQPGDIQLLKNSTILHARSEYEDWVEPERKRHLLRLWMTARSGFGGSDAMLKVGIHKKEGVASDAQTA